MELSHSNKSSEGSFLGALGSSETVQFIPQLWEHGVQRPVEGTVVHLLILNGTWEGA